MTTVKKYLDYAELAGTEYENRDGSISKSKTGHVWYEIYEKDSQRVMVLGSANG